MYNPYFPWHLLKCINNSVTPEGKPVQCCSEAATQYLPLNIISAFICAPTIKGDALTDIQHDIKSKFRKLFLNINTTLASSDTYSTLKLL